MAWCDIHQCPDIACGHMHDDQIPTPEITSFTKEDPHPDNSGDGEGGLISNARMALVRQAYQILKGMNEHDRGLVLCWFCRSCNRYVGPGESCHCHKVARR